MRSRSSSSMVDVFPARAGMNRSQHVACAKDVQVFPARAGMNRLHASISRIEQTRVPRTRGDEPA